MTIRDETRDEITVLSMALESAALDYAAAIASDASTQTGAHSFETECVLNALKGVCVDFASAMARAGIEAMR